MTDDPEDHRERLRDLSDRLMREAEAVRELESRKREAPISTPEFHRLANEIETRSRNVFRLADMEQATGEETSRSGASIDDQDDDS